MAWYPHSGHMAAGMGALCVSPPPMPGMKAAAGEAGRQGLCFCPSVRKSLETLPRALMPGLPGTSTQMLQGAWVLKRQGPEDRGLLWGIG